MKKHLKFYASLRIETFGNKQIECHGELINVRFVSQKKGGRKQSVTELKMNALNPSSAKLTWSGGGVTKKVSPEYPQLLNVAETLGEEFFFALDDLQGVPLRFGDYYLDIQISGRLGGRPLRKKRLTLKLKANWDVWQQPAKHGSQTVYPDFASIVFEWDKGEQNA